MKYRKTSHVASLNFFFVNVTLGNAQVFIPPPSSTYYLDTHGGSVTMARNTFLNLSILCRYTVPATERKYCFSSLKHRKKKISDEMKHRGCYTIQRFLSQTDPDFMPIDLLKFRIK